ncbi:unnamed protein product, partial [Prorocentrum cordatum]
ERVSSFTGPVPSLAFLFPESLHAASSPRISGARPPQDRVVDASVVEEINRHCAATGERYVDPQFPPLPRSLYLSEAEAESWECISCRSRSPLPPVPALPASREEAQRQKQEFQTQQLPGRPLQTMAAPAAPGTSFLGQMGVTIEIAGVSEWKSALNETTRRLLAHEAIRTSDPTRIERIMTAYVNMAYFNERIPATSMQAVVKAALDDRGQGARGRNRDRRGPRGRSAAPRREPGSKRAASPAAAASTGPPAGEPAADLGAAGQRAAASGAVPPERQGRAPGDPVLIWSRRRAEWLQGKVLSVFASDQWHDGFQVRAGTLRVKSPAGTKYVLPELIAAVIEGGPAGTSRIGAGGFPAPPSLECKIARPSRLVEEAAPTRISDEDEAEVPTQEGDADPLALGFFYASQGAQGAPLPGPVGGASPRQQTHRRERAPLPQPLPRLRADGPGAAAGPGPGAAAAAAAALQMVAVEPPALNAAAAAADPPGKQLAFAARSAQDTVEEQLWQWFEALVANGSANLAPKCTATAPCVKVRNLGLALNWMRTTDGRVRVWGKRPRPIILEMLRKSHLECEPGNAAHGRITRRQLDPARAAQRLQRRVAQREPDCDAKPAGTTKTGAPMLAT